MQGHYTLACIDSVVGGETREEKAGRIKLGCPIPWGCWVLLIRLSIGYLYTPTSLVRKIFQSKIELGGGREGKQKNTEKNFLNYSWSAINLNPGWHSDTDMSKIVLNQMHADDFNTCHEASPCPSRTPLPCYHFWRKIRTKKVFRILLITEPKTITKNWKVKKPIRTLTLMLQTSYIPGSDLTSYFVTFIRKIEHASNYKHF